MSAVHAALWGAAGGLVVECLQFASAIRRVGGWPWRWPSEPGPVPLLASIAVRLAAGAGLAAAAAASQQVTTVFGACALGVTAPLVIEKILQAASAARLSDQRLSHPVPGSAAADPETGKIEAEAGDARA
jgi:hypothetical protein